MYKGKKVLLRCHCEEDIEKLHEFINDYEVKKFLDLETVLPLTK